MSATAAEIPRTSLPTTHAVVPTTQQSYSSVWNNATALNLYVIGYPSLSCLGVRAGGCSGFKGAKKGLVGKVRFFLQRPGGLASSRARNLSLPEIALLKKVRGLLHRTSSTRAKKVSPSRKKVRRCTRAKKTVCAERVRNGDGLKPTPAARLANQGLVVA